MTMEMEPDCFDPNPPRKSYNPFDSDDENVFAKEDCIEFEKNDDALAFDMWEGSVFSEASEKNVQHSSEFIVGFNDSACQSIKDIVVDEGVPTKNEIDGVGGDDSAKIAELELDLVGSDSRDLVYDVVDDRSTFEHGSIGEDEDPVEKILDIVSLDKQENVPSKEPATDLSIEHEESEFKPIEDTKEEETLPGSSEHSAAIEESARDSNKAFDNTKTDSETTIDDLRSSTKLDRGKLEDEPQNSEVEKPPDTERLEKEAPSSSLRSSSARGETSFPSFASSITFAAPVGYSGSLSCQSESSAGSTRSFAFPVLQSEWISSPERMARADRRRYRKFRRWLQAVICCSF